MFPPPRLRGGGGERATIARETEGGQRRRSICPLHRSRRAARAAQRVAVLPHARSARGQETLQRRDHRGVEDFAHLGAQGRDLDGALEPDEQRPEDRDAADLL